MSLNKFTNISTGFELDLDIGCDELKANNITTDNIDANTINGGPIGGVTNPLTSDLKLGGFAIIEPLAAVSPALNISQLDPAKKIDLKVGGLAKVEVKNNEIQLNENLNMNNNNIDDVNEVNSSNTLLLGNNANNDEVAINPNINSGVVAYASAGKKISLVADGGNNVVNIEPTKTDFLNNVDMGGNDVTNVSTIDMVNDGSSEISNVFRINGSSVNSLYMIGNILSATATNQDVILRCNNPSSCIRFRVGTSATPNRLFVCDTEVKSFVPLDMDSNDINNVANINVDDNAIIENTNNGYSLRNSRDGPTDNIFIAPTENIFFKALNLQDGVNMIFPFPNNQIGHPFIGEKLQALWVNSINGFTPVGGLFSGTSDSLTLSASTVEQTILPLTFVGTLSVPPDGFQIGDSFHCVLAGDFGSNNGDTLTIRLKAGPASTTILGTLVVPLNNSSASSFETEIDFQIRNVGGAGVADIVTNFDFTYNQSGGGGAFVGERGVSQNNTTFDTTVLNTLEITAQFSSNNVANSIKTVVSKLTKDF